MERVEITKISFKLSEDDISLIDLFIRTSYQRKTLKTAMDNIKYYAPLLSMYAKLTPGKAIDFTYDEKKRLCDLLRENCCSLRNWRTDIKERARELLGILEIFN